MTCSSLAICKRFRNTQLQFATLVFLQDHVKVHYDATNEEEQAEFRQFAQKLLLLFVSFLYVVLIL